MAKLTDFQKAINYIKKLIGNKDMEVPSDILNELYNMLGFSVMVEKITENIKEQEISYIETIVDGTFLNNYIRKNKKIVSEFILQKNNLSELELFKAIFNDMISMIIEEYHCDRFSNPILSDVHTQYERISWDSLFRYVKYNVMHYEAEQMLDKKIINKLKELQTGRILGNSKQKATCRYSFDDILLAFKFCYFDIEKAIRMKSFDNDIKKFNYICAIVKDNINTVIERTKSRQEANEKILQADFSHINHPKAEYKRKTEECLDELNDLW